MKKKFVILLALLLAISLPISVGAETESSSESSGGNTTELTVTVDSSYTASIPANTTLTADDANAQKFGEVTVKDVKHIGTLYCTIAGTPLASGSNTIPVTYQYQIGNANTQDFEKFAIVENGAPVSAALTATITQDEWNKALAGTYKATVTFTFEIGDSATAEENEEDKTLLLDASAFNAALKELVGEGISNITHISIFANDDCSNAIIAKDVKDCTSIKVGKSQNSQINAYLLKNETTIYIMGPDGITSPAGFTKEAALAGFNIIEDGLGDLDPSIFKD